MVKRRLQQLNLIPPVYVITSPILKERKRRACSNSINNFLALRKWKNQQTVPLLFTFRKRGKEKDIQRALLCTPLSFARWQKKLFLMMRESAADWVSILPITAFKTYEIISTQRSWHGSFKGAFGSRNNGLTSLSKIISWEFAKMRGDSTWNQQLSVTSSSTGYGP